MTRASGVRCAFKAWAPCECSHALCYSRRPRVADAAHPAAPRHRHRNALSSVPQVQLPKKAGDGKKRFWQHITGSPYNTGVVPIVCLPGARQDDTASECWCIEGWEQKQSADEGSCRKCQNGFHKNKFTKEDRCISCPFREDTNGTLGSLTQKACRCQPEYYDPTLRYNNASGALVEKQEVIVCYSNSYYPVKPDEAFKPSDLAKYRCHKCPVCATCYGNEVIGLAQKHWTILRDDGSPAGKPVMLAGKLVAKPAGKRLSREFYECPLAKNGACLGGTAPTCKKGYSGVACQTCTWPEFARSGGACEPCGDNSIAGKIGMMMLGAPPGSQSAPPRLSRP